uniref:Failed axon connections homolog n=1 Tax=Plectus sambesii TaxID=2011161 RepID=A0A914X127_9BILA
MQASVMEWFESLPVWGKAAAVGGAVLAASVPVYLVTKRPRPSPYKSDWKQGVVYLYQVPRFSTIPSASPYCLKLETWLRMADITYENVDVPMSVRSREGLVPFVELNGVEYPDSGLAIRDLTKFLAKEAMEAHLNDEQKSASRAFEKMIEHSTMWTYGMIRYLEKFDEFAELFPPFLGPLQPLLVWMMKRSIRSGVAQRIKAVGIGCHPRDEIINIGLEDLRAVSNYLGNKHYLTGYKPTRVDATLFGFLAQVVYMPIASPHNDLIQQECTNLKEYCDRIKGRFWPDWNECTQKRSLHTEWKKRI